jgi:hypothetical protein
MSTQVWAPASGKWSAVGRNPIDPNPTAPVDPTPVDPNPGVPGADPTAPLSRQLPDLPTVKYTDLYRTGDTLQRTIDRMTTAAVLEFPSGEFLYDDFGPYGYGLFTNGPGRLRGISGQGAKQTRIGIRKGSSTKVAQVTATSNPLTQVRIGSREQTLCHDFTLFGTDQPISSVNENRPHNYGALVNYMGVDSYFVGLKFEGAGPGNWNAPPGETFSGINNYKDVRTRVLDCEMTGYNPEGSRVGGSPIGGNNSTDMWVEDCWFHDSYVSGVTWSFTGVPTNIDAISRGVTTHRIRVEHNANHTLSAGKRFAPLNHENVGGKVQHHYAYLQADNSYEWNFGFVAMNNLLFDNPDFQIIEPTWVGGPPKNNGMFSVSMPYNYAQGYNDGINKQVTPPRVVKNGRDLKPLWIKGNPSQTLTQSPDEYFVVVNEGAPR